jgi:DNA-binding protein HU-beta
LLRIPLSCTHFCDFDAKNGLFSGQSAQGGQDKNRLTTITLKHLAAAIAEEQELSKKQAETILTDLVAPSVGSLCTLGLFPPGFVGDDDHQAPEKGERIRIVGLGILQVRKRTARIGRNPATGEAIQIKASKKVAFRATKELKEAV